jgi:hypothetical protein
MTDIDSSPVVDIVLEDGWPSLCKEMTSQSKSGQDITCLSQSQQGELSRLPAVDHALISSPGSNMS